MVVQDYRDLYMSRFPEEQGGRRDLDCRAQSVVAVSP
jgi:hypothetical protein